MYEKNLENLISVRNLEVKIKAKISLQRVVLELYLQIYH